MVARERNLMSATCLYTQHKSLLHYSNSDYKGAHVTGEGSALPALSSGWICARIESLYVLVKWILAKEALESQGALYLPSR